MFEFKGKPASRFQQRPYEWLTDSLAGDKVRARGYHSATASQDGSKVYIFGGIAACGSIDSLAVIDVLSWQCEVPVTAGEVPPGRFGCSMTVHADKLWVVGGGYGRDLARSGHDLKDVYTLDLLSRPMEWSKVTMMNTLPQPQGDNAMGRCHASSRVGNKLVMFGGSLELGNAVTWLDLDAKLWGKPAAVLGKAPGARMSAVMGFSAGSLLVFGGWIYDKGEKQQVEAAAAAATAAAAAEAAGPSGDPGNNGPGSGSGRRGRPTRRTGWSLGNGGLQEMLRSHMEVCQSLSEQARTIQQAIGSVPVGLVRALRAAMQRFHDLRSRLEEVRDPDPGLECFTSSRSFREEEEGSDDERDGEDSEDAADDGDVFEDVEEGQGGADDDEEDEDNEDEDGEDEESEGDSSASSWEEVNSDDIEKAAALANAEAAAADAETAAAAATDGNETVASKNRAPDVACASAEAEQAESAGGGGGDVEAEGGCLNHNALVAAEGAAMVEGVLERAAAARAASGDAAFPVPSMEPPSQ
ncbi:MAG: hypothetical protein WDW38_006043 [Sanguina aurantia]